jgi:hypothetical protein
MNPRIHKKYDKAAVLRFFTPGAGEILAIEGIEKAQALPGVRTVSIDLQPGDTIAPIISDGTRPGYVITYGETRDEAVSRADAVEQTIKFVFSKR